MIIASRLCHHVSLANRACERSGAGLFAAPSLKPFLLYPAPRSAHAPAIFSKAAHRSAPAPAIFDPLRSGEVTKLLLVLIIGYQYRQSANGY